MRFPFRRSTIILAAFALVTAGASVVWERGEEEKFHRAAPRAHFYGIPTWPLEAIDVKVVFFASRDAEYTSASCAAARAGRGATTPYRSCNEPDVPAMREYLEEEIFPELAAFHEREFSGSSSLSIAVYPDLVLGMETAEIYESDFLVFNASNPTLRLEQELRERMFSLGGDLFWPAFSQTPEQHHEILLIVYAASVPLLDEGRAVPALIGDIGSTALVFMPVFDPSFRSEFPNVASIVYHEMLHAMGVPEQYDIGSPNVWDQINAREDVMGRGAQGPLRDTFIGDDIKARLGVAGRT